MRGGPAAWGDLAAGGGGPGPCRGGRRGGTLPQFLASNCISDICEEHFFVSICVSKKMVISTSSIPDTCQKLWQGVAGRRRRTGSRGCSPGGALEAVLPKLFPAAEGRVISRSFRKPFMGLRRAGITRAARITSGQAAVTC